MTTRTIIEYTGMVEPARLTDQVESALFDCDSEQFTYDAGSFELTMFETDIETPVICVVEGSGYGHLYGGERTRVRVQGEFRMQTRDSEPLNGEMVEANITIREFPA
jgi:hypothetical protein